MSSTPKPMWSRFTGPNGRVDAIAAVEQGELDAFLGDDILTIAEILYENESVDNLTLVPELPLTCEFYGLALPNDDAEWVGFVNGFLQANADDYSWEERLGEYAPYALDTLILLPESVKGCILGKVGSKPCPSLEGSNHVHRYPRRRCLRPTCCHRRHHGLCPGPQQTLFNQRFISAVPCL